MKRINSFILFLAIILAGCSGTVAPVSDWCYIYDFTVSSHEFNMLTGNWVNGVGIVSSDNFLNVTYTNTAFVQSTNIAVQIYRTAPAGATTITSNGHIYNNFFNLTQTFPPLGVPVDNPFTVTITASEFVASNTVSVVMESQEEVAIQKVIVYGNGGNPFPVNNCNDLTLTPTYTVTPTGTQTVTSVPPTLTATASRTLFPDTATPSQTGTPMPTLTPQWACTFNFTTGQQGWITTNQGSAYAYSQYVSGSGFSRANITNTQARLAILSPLWNGYQPITGVTVYLNKTHTLGSGGSVLFFKGDGSGNNGTWATPYGSGASLPTSFSYTGTAFSITGSDRFGVALSNATGTNGTAFPLDLYIQSVKLTGTGSPPSLSQCGNTTPTATPTATPTITPTPTITNTPSPTATGTQTPTPTNEPIFYCLYLFSEGNKGWGSFSSTKQARYGLDNGIGWQTVYDTVNDPYTRSMYVRVPFAGRVTQIIANFEYTRGSNTSDTTQYSANLGSMNDLLNGISNYLKTEINLSNGTKSILWSGDFYIDYGIGFSARSGYDGIAPIQDPGGNVVLKSVSVSGRGAHPSECYDILPTPTASALPPSYTPPTGTRQPLATSTIYSPSRTPIILATRTPIPQPTPTYITTANVITSTPDGTSTSIVQTATALYGGTPSPNPSSSVTPLLGTNVTGTPYGTPSTVFGLGNECYPNCGPLEWNWGIGSFQDLLDMLGYIVQIVSGFINLIFQWIGQVITRLFALIATFWNTPAQAIPGLPHCVTAPLNHDLCAIYYIMDWTLFAPSTPGAYIVPILVTLMNLYFVFYFIRFIYWLVRRAVKDVTDVT